MKKTNWALIGCGKVVLKNKTTPFINLNNTISAICTTSITNSKMAKKRLNLNKCKCYNNAIEMIKNEKIDAIYICTPPKYHYYYLKLLAKYKIPVYVEKPFTLNYNEAKEITEIYMNNNTYLFIAHYKRLTKKIQTLKKIVDKSIVGEIKQINGDFQRTFNKDLLENSWIYNKSISGGGRFFDIAPHILDIIYYIFGEFNDIKSSVILEEKLHDCENIVNVIFSLQNNIKCSLSFDFISNEDKDIVTFIGTKGKILLSINRDIPLQIFDNNNNLIKTYNFPKIKTWGIETVKEINKVLNNKKTSADLCRSFDATIIQKYIDIILGYSRD